MFPTYPRGATISSLLIAFAQTGQLASPRMRLLRPERKLPVSAMNLQHDLAYLAEHVFTGVATDQELLLDHTLAPIYLSAFNPRHITHDMLPTLLRSSTYGRLSGYEWRSCPECVAEDQELFGCGHWRREHQIPSVHICTKHLIPLHDRCGNQACGHQIGTLDSDRLPGQPCPSCGQLLTRAGQIQPISDDYVAYCKLFTEAIHARIPELEQRNWWKLTKMPSTLRYRDSQAYKKLLKSFLSWDSLGTFAAKNVAWEHLCRPKLSKVWHGDISGLILLAAIYRSKFGALEKAPPIKWSEVASSPQLSSPDHRDSSPSQ